MTERSASAQIVQDWLVAHGSSAVVFEREQPGRTAAEAAALLGCDIAQIAKSIIFRNATAGGSVLVITSGANRVDEAKVAALTGVTLAKADANFVREHTGFVIGGVPPVAHAKPGIVLLDADLLRFATVFPAGGTPHAMFEIAADELVRLSGARVADIRQQPR